MLDIMRENAKSVLTYVIFGILIVVFAISFGPGSRGCSGEVRGQTYAAEVNGHDIQQADFEQQYAQTYRMMQQQSGGNLTPELAAQLGLRDNVLNHLIDRELVLQEAKKHGLAVSDDELSKAIQKIPAFQKDGAFDMDLYKQYAANAYGSPAKFEERLREDLLYQKMMAGLRETVKVSSDEVKEAWLKDNDKVSLEFVRFPTALVKDEVKVTDAQAEQFLGDHADQVKKFYEDNSFRYDKKKRVRARHILVKVAQDAPKAEDDAAKKKIDDLAARLKKGEDFAALAKQYSEDPGSRDKGGELGFFGEGTMAKPFEDAAFALKPGEISAPVRTRFGWHIVQTEEVQPAQKISFDAAKKDIARELVEDEQAKALTVKKAQAALDQAKGGKTLADLFPAPKDDKAATGPQPPHVEETGLFSLSGDYVPKAGSVPGLAADAFKANAGDALPKVYDTPTGALIAQVKERQKPDEAKFAEKQDEFRDRLSSKKESEVEQAWLKMLRDRSEIDVNQALVKGGAPAPTSAED